MLAWVLFAITLVLLIGVTYVAYKFYRKAVVYDTVFTFLYDDIEINLRQFSKISSSNVFSNEPEVQTAHQNMMIMGKRLNEILSRMEEATGLDLRPPPPPQRPSVR
jgi:hypothetical protein